MLYYGGKSRLDRHWYSQRIGKVGVWSEPCCGTAVMTMNNPEPAPREVICDLNAYICNFYRSLRADPDAVAYLADWPTNHHDLTARHRWLLAQGPELRERMVADPARLRREDRRAGGCGDSHRGSGTGGAILRSAEKDEVRADRPAGVESTCNGAIQAATWRTSARRCRHQRTGAVSVAAGPRAE